MLAVHRVVHVITPLVIEILSRFFPLIIIEAELAELRVLNG